MRVLMRAWEWPLHMGGGLGKHVVELLPELVDEEVEVHLVTPRFKGDSHDDAIISAATGQAAGSRAGRRGQLVRCFAHGTPCGSGLESCGP